MSRALDSGLVSGDFKRFQALAGLQTFTLARCFGFASVAVTSTVPITQGFSFSDASVHSRFSGVTPAFLGE